MSLLLKDRVKFYAEHWKLAIHFIFGTYRFGVNDEWWSRFPSIFGVPWYQKINPLKMRDCWQGMVFRIFACKFLSEKTATMAFPRTVKRFREHTWRWRKKGGSYDGLTV